MEIDNANVEVVQRPQPRSYVDMYLERWRVPWFLITMTIVQIAAFGITCEGHSLDACLNMNDRTAPTWSLFINHKLNDFWRALSYGLFHQGALHLGSNMLTQIMIGGTLEAMHGSIIIAIIYYLACQYAALFFGAFNDTWLVGASGAIYGLIGARWGNIMINWAEMEYRWQRLGFLLVLAAFDLVAYYASRDSNIGYSAHFGGLLCGAMVAPALLYNIRTWRWERLLGIIGLISFALSEAALLYVNSRKIE